MYPLVEIKLAELNYIDVKANPSVLKDNYELTIQNCVPRPMPGYHHRPKVKKGRAPWSIPISLFKDYVPDTDVRIRKDFIIDADDEMF